MGYNKGVILLMLGGVYMKVVSIINYKGGVGKTTLSANLVAGISKKKRVLAIDLDPQANLTFSFISIPTWRQKFEKENTIKHWFDAIIGNEQPLPPLKNLIVENRGIHIISSHLGLIDVDIELAVGLAGATPKQQKMNYIKTFSYLRKGLETLKDDYDLVIIDCPPNFSVVTKNALIASDYYVIPTKMDYLSTLGINQLRNHVNTLVREYNGFCEPDNRVDPVLLGVIANMISIYGGNPIRAQQDYIEEIQRNKIPLFSSMVRENKTLFSSRPEYAEPVILQDHNAGTYADIVSELEALQAEFEKKAGI